ncbi:unnamed protein product [Amoebophrya sp. A120]|nr:unnamed protein product [Amoebophrya sp. A120]|eukprot:GSA120T00017525001.1
MTGGAASSSDPRLFALECGGPIFDCAWHPREQRLFVTAAINGNADLFDVESENQTCLVRRKRHNGAVRCVGFSPKAGDRWATGSSDCTALLSDTETSARISRTTFEAAVNVLRFVDVSSSSVLGNNDSSQLLVCGLDDGSLHFLDARTKGGVVATLAEQEDFVSDLLFLPGKNHLCATSGDGTLGVFDVRKKKLFALSDPQDDELLSLALCKDGRKIVCGAQEGDCKIFTVDDYGDCKDRIVLDSGGGSSVAQRDTLELFGVGTSTSAGGTNKTDGAGAKRGAKSVSSTTAVEKVSTDALCNLGNSEEYLLSGGSDGQLRLLGVHSAQHGNRVVARLGLHGEEEMPIEVIRQSPWSPTTVASCGHDGRVQFWDFSNLLASVCQKGGGALTVSGEGAADSLLEPEGHALGGKKKKKRKVLDLGATSVRANDTGKNNFWSGLQF